jgi:hypothetical protein
MQRIKGLRGRSAAADNLQIADQNFEPLFHMSFKWIVVKMNYPAASDGVSIGKF